MMAADVRELIWRQVSEHLFVTREQFMAELDQWEIEPRVLPDGAIAGGVMRKGPAFHFFTFGKVSITRQMMREALAPQFERYGYVTTRTPKVDERQHRFNRLMGFVATGEDEYDVHYRLDRIRSATERSA